MKFKRVLLVGSLAAAIAATGCNAAVPANRAITRGYNNAYYRTVPQRTYNTTNKSVTPDITSRSYNRTAYRSPGSTTVLNDNLMPMNYYVSPWDYNFTNASPTGAPKALSRTAPRVKSVEKTSTAHNTFNNTNTSAVKSNPVKSNPVKRNTAGGSALGSNVVTRNTLNSDNNLRNNTVRYSGLNRTATQQPELRDNTVRYNNYNGRNFRTRSIGETFGTGSSQSSRYNYNPTGYANYDRDFAADTAGIGFDQTGYYHSNVNRPNRTAMNTVDRTYYYGPFDYGAGYQQYGRNNYGYNNYGIYGGVPGLTLATENISFGS